VHVLELHMAAHLVQDHRCIGIGDLFLLLHELEHPLGRRSGLLQDVGDVADLGDGLGKGAHVLDKGLDIAHGDEPLGRQPGAHDADHHVTDVANKAHDGKDQRREELGLPRGVVELAVEPVKAPHAFGLPVERLDHQVGAVHLLHVAVDIPQIFLLRTKELLRFAHHNDHRDHRKGQNQQRRQGHLPGDGEHHHQHAHHGDHRGDHLRQALVEGVVDRVDVVGQPREHLAVAGAVKVAQRHTVDLFSNVAPQPVSDIGRDPGHDPALDVVQQGRRQIQAQHGEQHLADIVKIDARTRALDHRKRVLEQAGRGTPQDLGADDVEHGRASGHQHHDQNRDAVRAEISDELAHGALEIAGLFAAHQAHGPAATAATPLCRPGPLPVRRRGSRCTLRRGPVGVLLCHASSSSLSCE